LPLPANDADRVAYLEELIRMQPDNKKLKQRLERLQKGPEPVAEEAGAEESPEPALICGSS
jgi:hypothetical protein